MKLLTRYPDHKLMLRQKFSSLFINDKTWSKSICKSFNNCSVEYKDKSKKVDRILSSVIKSPKKANVIRMKTPMVEESRKNMYKYFTDI